MATEQPNFKFKGYRITKSEINIAENGDINKNLNITFSASSGVVGETGYFLKLSSAISSQDNSLNILIELTGNFEFARTLQEDERDTFFKYNAPSILFPYIRAHVSTLTAVCGIEPLLLPTLNFAEGLAKTKKQ